MYEFTFYCSIEYFQYDLLCRLVIQNGKMCIISNAELTKKQTNKQRQKQAGHDDKHVLSPEDGRKRGGEKMRRLGKSQ